MKKADAWERAALTLILLGVAIRIYHLQGGGLDADSAWYVTMATTLHQQGEFTIPWADGLAYTQHFPPLYPAFVSLFLIAFGQTMLAVKLANLTAAILFIGATYYTTNDLYGRRPALAITAIAATLPTLINFDQGGLSETFVATLFAITIWGILKSLDNPRYIVIAGLFAGLGYLAKSSMGPFFLLAGLAGFTWRFAYVKWNVFRDKWYLLGGLLFASSVIPWAARNIHRHGWPHWQTQPYADTALKALFAQPTWPLTVLLAIAWATLLVGLQCAPFLPGLRTARPDLRAERTTGLIMAIATPITVASFFIAGFSTLENYQIPLSQHPLRYAITPIIPLLWLSMRWLNYEPPAPNTPPTTGRDLPKNERAFLIIGTTILALTLAFRQPTILATTKADAITLILGLTLGTLAIALARPFAWQAHHRTTNSGTTWRATPNPQPRRNYLLATPLLAATLLAQELAIPLLAAATAATLLTNWRHRTIITATILIAWSMGGSYWAWPNEEIGTHLNEISEPGDTIAIQPGYQPWFTPFLSPTTQQIGWNQNATYLIQTTPTPDPENYTKIQSHTRHHDTGPTAWLRETYLQTQKIVDPPTFTIYKINTTTP